jgi:hypothetical protein
MLSKQDSIQRVQLELIIIDQLVRANHLVEAAKHVLFYSSKKSENPSLLMRSE